MLLQLYKELLRFLASGEKEEKDDVRDYNRLNIV